MKNGPSIWIDLGTARTTISPKIGQDESFPDEAGLRFPEARILEFGCFSSFGITLFFAVSTGTDSKMFLEASVEILRTAEAGLITDFRDGEPFALKHSGRLFQTLLDKITLGGHPQEFLCFAIEGCSPDAHQGRQLVYIEIGIVQMLIYTGVHPREEKLVCTIGNQDVCFVGGSWYCLLQLLFL